MTGNKIYIARAALHMWEEPCISGNTGSGAVFFSGCPLRCVYCQNYQIAQGEYGRPVTIERLSEIFLELQSQNANNINLVTPTHYTPEIIEAVTRARRKGLILPIVYNCSGYERVDTIRQLDGIVDIYLVDVKYMEPELARKYSHAENYPDVVKAALAEMVHQIGRQINEFGITQSAIFNEEGIMQKGVIVRHLLLPNHVKNAKAVIRYVYDTYGDTVYLSLMNQYTPLPQVAAIKDLNRKVTKREYDSIIDYALSIGVEHGFIQEGNTAKESFIPPFDYEGV
jgi:putative pyruvate formate lyase activating enzyme